MGSSIQFEKWHGLGNDFVIVDQRRPNSAAFSPASASLIADRRIGVGCDQLLILGPNDAPDGSVIVKILNADGSTAQQCGNGMRCVAAYLARDALRAGQRNVQRTILTDGGRVSASVVSVSEVAVDLGVPNFDHASLPFVSQDAGPCQQHTTQAGPVEFRVVSMGNPHAVIRSADVDSAPVAEIGALLGADSAFPEGVNVGFMEVKSPDAVSLRVFERGAGETKACGSGACAAVAVGIKAGWLEGPVTVSLPGGKLVINWQGPGTSVSMTGPATYVYSGEINT